MSNRFCTLFDHRYLSRGLALYRSLEAQADDFTLHILALTPECARALREIDLVGGVVTELGELEGSIRDFEWLRSSRSAAGFVFTLKPLWIRWLFANEPEAETVTYLDSDMYFFDRVENLVREFEGFSVALTPHRFGAAQARRERFGRFNAGFVAFRRDRNGEKALQWWCDRCIEWCEDKALPDGRFADQGYLTRIPDIFPSVKIVDHPGINLAPWNLSEAKLEVDIGEKGDRVPIVDGKRVLLYHFHGLKGSYLGIYILGLSAYDVIDRKAPKSLLYRPYVKALTRVIFDVGKRHKGANSSVRRRYFSFRDLFSAVITADFVFHDCNLFEKFRNNIINRIL